jgi:hypothetical protein
VQPHGARLEFQHRRVGREEPDAGEGRVEVRDQRLGAVLKDGAQAPRLAQGHLHIGAQGRVARVPIPRLPVRVARRGAFCGIIARPCHRFCLARGK